MSPVLADIVTLHIWTGTWADILLFFVYAFLFGWFFTLGQRVGNKLP